MTRKNPTSTGKSDSLTYSADLDWYFHEQDSRCGLKSSQGGQIDTLVLGVAIESNRSEVEVDTHAAAQCRELFKALQHLSEYNYALLRVWYTQPTRKLSEIQASAAHKEFYESRRAAA